MIARNRVFQAQPVSPSPVSTLQGSDPPRLTLRAFLAGGYLESRPQQPKSLEQIELAVDMLHLWHGEEVFCDEIDREFLLAFRAWRLQDRPVPVCPRHELAMRLIRGTQYRCPQRDCRERSKHAAPVKPATANKSFRIIQALWFEAIDQGLNTSAKKRTRKLKEDLDNLPCWTQEELAAILASCALEDQRKQQRSFILPCRPAGFWRALILVIYDTGSRISAVMALRPADLDWRNRTVTLRAGTKKDRKCQVIGLDEQTFEALKAVYDPQRPYLFPWPYGHEKRDWRTLRNRYKEILRRAGLPDDRIRLFHCIRRTTATELTIASEGDLSVARKQLGHSAESVTERYIDRRRLDETQRNARLLPRPTM